MDVYFTTIQAQCIHTYIHTCLLACLYSNCWSRSVSSPALSCVLSLSSSLVACSYSCLLHLSCLLGVEFPLSFSFGVCFLSFAAVLFLSLCSGLLQASFKASLKLEDLLDSHVLLILNLQPSRSFPRLVISRSCVTLDHGDGRFFRGEGARQVLPAISRQVAAVDCRDRATAPGA
jgi:hypothetical protein